MSRMDRYKHIHEEAESTADSNITKEKKVFNPRKIIPKQNPKQEETFKQEKLQQNHYSDEPIINKPNEKKPKRPRKKRRLSWPKKIGLLLVLIIGLSVVFFFKGKSYAEHDTSLPKETVETFNGVNSANGAKNILIVGSDTRGEDTGRADTIMVLQLDGPAKKPKLISFMRDTFVDIPGIGPDKINAAYSYGGADLVRQTRVENFNLDCKYYAKVDFQSFERIVDSLFPGGVKIEAEKDINLDGVDIAKGEQKMDGHTLLQYARFRMDEEGDFGRVRRQQQVMSAVMGQLKNPLTVIRMPESLGRLVGYMSTDVPTSFMLLNGTTMLLKGGGGVDRLAVPVEDSWSYDESDYAGSILQIDLDMNRSAIENFFVQ